MKNFTEMSKKILSEGMSISDKLTDIADDIVLYYVKDVDDPTDPKARRQLPEKARKAVEAIEALIESM